MSSTFPCADQRVMIVVNSDWSGQATVLFKRPSVLPEAVYAWTLPAQHLVNAVLDEPAKGVLDPRHRSPVTADVIDVPLWVIAQAIRTAARAQLLGDLQDWIEKR